MSVNFGNLLSNASTQALGTFSNSQMQNKYTGAYQSYSSILSGISTADNNGNYHGFNSSSIFSNSSGISQAGSSSSYSRNNWQTGKDGLNLNGPVDKQTVNSASIPQTNNPYSNGAFGASLIDNYFTSIQSVALGQYAPTSVFEQRLNYHLPYSEQNKPGSMLGNYSNYFNVDSVANNKTNSLSGYNVFGSSSSNNNAGVSKAAGAQTVSRLMSLLA